jgi:DNA-binding response OmpR family regulator
MYRILVIEDDPAIREALTMLLEQEHYKVEKTGDGISGIEKALQGKPHLILLDINLPGKGGFDVCRELRGMNFTNPIIIISSKIDQLDKVLGLELGADDYVTKPFDSRELIARVRANLRKSTDNQSSGEYQRKLCSIFFSDMFGYSEMMNRDEITAIEILKEHNHILREAINHHGGKVIEITGDAFLASFETVSAAVECGCAVQEELQLRNKPENRTPKIEVRIGIHLGDVFIFPDNIKGDVLNIASRVQQIASPGSVFITDAVYDVMRNNKKYNFEYKGSHKLKNIEKPVELYSAGRISKLNLVE